MNHLAAYSVLMSVYKGDHPLYLKQSIDSMLQQTVLPSELVIILNGPLGTELEQVIQSCQGGGIPIKTVRIEINRGHGLALATGLQQCDCELVARMDADDISCSNRCELQLEQFLRHPELDLLGGQIAEFYSHFEGRNTVRSVPMEYKDIIAFAKRRNPFNHMTVMFKKQAVLQAGNYLDAHFLEDYDLWVRMILNGCRCGNLPVTVAFARVDGMEQRRGGIEYARSLLRFQKKLLEWNFISKREYMENCTVRIFASLIPTGVRRWVYRHMLRIRTEREI